MKNRPVGAMTTDIQTDKAKLIVGFGKFANAPKSDNTHKVPFRKNMKGLVLA